jgi:hypothetical protein
MHRLWFLSLAATLLLTGCPTLPSGPSVMVLPGSGKDFEQFKVDDVVCRNWALQQVGTTTNQAATDAAVTSAAVGTAVGAAAGAAIGAASGDAAAGAAVGSGVGLAGGAAVGADRAAGAQWSVQQRYDIAYMQCMYAKGNQVPIPGGYQRPATARSYRDVPPPPAGNPPPPPPMESD